MLLEIGMFDAYGAGFEFVKDPIIKKRHNLTQYERSWIDSTAPGSYTDDCQMSIAIAELMLHEENWDELTVAKYFLEAFKRDERPGYAQGFYDFLMATDTAEQFMENIRPNSKRNGAAMRAVPLGLIENKQEMLEKARIQAKVTHNTPEGIISAQAVALAAHFFLHENGKKADLHKYICEQTGWDFSNHKTTRCACDAIETIDAVLTVLSQANTMTQVLDLSVKLGGDTDSVAAIAGGIASLSREYINDLPEFLYKDLENGEYGRGYLERLDDQLVARFS